MGMFLSQVEGPESADQFAAVFAAEIRPQLAEVPTMSALSVWQDSNRAPYVSGFAEADPTEQIAQVLHQFEWQASTVFLTASLLPQHGATTRICDMPNNPHAITGRVMQCVQQSSHEFSDDHRVASCPVCGGRLV